MNKRTFKITAIITSLSLLSLLPMASITAETTSYTTSFDEFKAGQLPKGWIISETASTGWFSSPSTPEDYASWSVVHDNAAPSGSKILALKKINNPRRSTFNIIYTNNIKLKNGDITVKLRADSGKVDQGGGPIWRVKDKNNYYVARYNPLENNFRVYSVKEGSRSQLKSARKITVKQGEWFEIKIRHTGDHIVGFLNGKKLLDVHDDTHLSAGGVGLWTKADAVTAFDDFSVTQSQ